MKFLLQYYIIFVANYRHNICTNEIFRERTKSVMADIANQYDFSIQTQETDPSKSNHRLWSEYEQYLRYFYWKENLLWTRGYFVSSVGNASADAIQAYIDSQG